MEIGDTLKYAGFKWIVIAKNGSPVTKNETVTLLAKDDDFGWHIFDKNNNNYASSAIRQYLNNVVKPFLRARDARPLEIDIPDVGCKDEVWLLSEREAMSLPKEIKKFVGFWWLRVEIGREKDREVCSNAFPRHIPIVNRYGWDCDHDVCDVCGIVRPAILVDRKELRGIRVHKNKVS